MIEIKGLQMDFGSTRILNDVNLCLKDSEQVFLQGPSGSGKTTLLRILAGLECPTSGEVLFDGVVFSNKFSLKAPAERNIGFVFQEPGLWPHMRVSANIFYACKESKRMAQQRTLELSKSCRIEALLNKFPNQLSMGEKRRVALARALAGNPKYLFLDEAFVNLDDELRVELVSWVRRLEKEEGMSVIYVSHDQNDWNRAGSSVWKCENKTIIEYSSK